MDNFNINDVYSENDWQDVSTPVIKEEAISENSNENNLIKEKAKKHNKHPVLTLQLTVALCVLLFLFVLKFIGTPVFESIMSWYKTETSKSLIFNGDFESFDFSSLFATSDEA